MSHKLEIERNAEGNILAYLTNESTDNGYRIAGPKGWGRTSNIATLVIHDSDLLVYLNKYAPELLENKS